MSGAFLQNGSTVNATNPGACLRLGNGPGSFGSYTLNAGTLNFSPNVIVVGESGTGNLSINGTTISSGNILVGINSGSSGTLNLNGATISCLGISTGSGSSTVNLTGTVTFDCQGVDPVVSAAMGGTGGLTKNGEGTLTLTGRNTFSGPTAVNSGTLAVHTSANDGRLDLTASLTINSGATVSVVGNNSLFGFGNFRVPVTVNAGGILTIGGNSTAHIKGQVYLNGGTLASTDTGSGSFGTRNLDQGTVTTSGGPMTSLISAQNVLLATPTTFNIPAGATNGIDLAVSGYFFSGALIKSGTGVMQLAGTNTYTGGTTISAGTLQLDDGVNRIGVVTNNIVNNANPGVRQSFRPNALRTASAVRARSLKPGQANLPSQL